MQVGLPVSLDTYIQRVGRAARADKDCRSIILLTQAESYFIHTNRQFPIKTHDVSKNNILKDATSSANISQSFKRIDPGLKEKAYDSYLGFMRGFTKNLKIDLAGLVKMAKELALGGMQCPKVPEMSKDRVR